MREEYQYFGLDWQYHRGDFGSLDEALDNGGSWSYVNIPHCTRYITPDEFHAYEGVSWYRKEFAVPENFKNKRVFLQFDAIMQSAAVYLNGNEIAYHEGGYMGFAAELTDYLDFNGNNVIAVRSDSNGSPDFAPTANKGIDFQYHGGIYRPVHLYAVNNAYITNELCEDEVAGGGIFITTENIDIENKKAELSVRVHVRNAGSRAFRGKVIVKFLKRAKMKNISEAEAKEADAIASSAEIFLKAHSAGYADITVNIENAVFWSTKNPCLYNVWVGLYNVWEDSASDLDLNSDLESAAKTSEGLFDRVLLRYGIRTVEWKKDGLYINGEKEDALHGVNYHQDIFGLGNAMTKDAIYRDVSLIKEAGIKFIRCSHYPHSPYFYDACDEMGLLCLNSITGWQVYVDSEKFKYNTVFEARQMVRRDRNHPCIVAWESSINEAGFTHEWGQAAHNAVHEEYPGKYCYTAAWKNGGDGEGIYPDIYLCAAQHGSKVYAAKTVKPVIISEYGDWNFGGTKSSSRQERGDGDNAMLLQCKNLEESYADNARQMLNAEVVADAYWDFTDYSPFSAETSVIKCGLVDMYRIPKPGYYFYKSQADEVMVYIANSWMKDSPTDVKIYSNCDEIELFLNGVSVGKKLPETMAHTDNPREERGVSYPDSRDYSYETVKHPPFLFELGRFEEGELKAVGYINGKKAAEHVVKTPKSPVKIRLMAAKNRVLSGDGEDAMLIYAELIDENTTIVPLNKVKLNVEVTGTAALIGPQEIYTVGGIAPFWIRASRAGTGFADIKVMTENIPGSGFVLGNLRMSVRNMGLPVEPESFSWWENVDDINIKAVDVAREKPAYASGCAPDCTAGYGNSGNPGLWWKAEKNAAGEWWMVDTGAVYKISSVNIVWPKAHAYQYIIETSADAFEESPEWVVLKDRSDNEVSSINTDDKVDGVGRYVKITLTGNIDDDNPASFNMFSVYGTKAI